MSSRRTKEKPRERMASGNDFIIIFSLVCHVRSSGVAVVRGKGYCEKNPNDGKKNGAEKKHCFSCMNWFFFYVTVDCIFRSIPMIDDVAFIKIGIKFFVLCSELFKFPTKVVVLLHCVHKHTMSSLE